MRKKTQTVVSIALLLVVAACSRDERRSRQYEVVEEGSASGVTSTIAGPGEQLPPLTDTNADTTTAFATLPTPPNVDPTLTTTDGSLADSLPDVTSSGQRYPGTYSQPRPTPPSRGTIEVTIPPRPAPEVTPPTSTSTETASPPPTTTDSTPPPPTGSEPKKEPPQEEETKKDDDEEDEKKPPAAPPPPPPSASARLR